MENKIIVLGAGVSGVSCALALQKLGYKVQIIAKELLSNNLNRPNFVSRYPSASIIPHSVTHPQLDQLFEKSQTVFRLLLPIEDFGIESHHHYELFSEPEDLPTYLSLLENTSVFKASSISSCTIKSLEYPATFGFGYECLFADWSIYFPYLIDSFLKSGGEIIQKEVSNSEYKLLDSEIIINCTELGSQNLLGVEAEPIIYRGHLVHIKNAPILSLDQDKTISYNFSPGKKFYSSENEALQDVYCYSRSDGWVLGGSRQKGTLDEKGEWIGENLIEPISEIDGIRFPEQIISVNSDIIKTSFGIDINSYNDRTAHVGYRFMGNKEDGLRIESEESSKKFIIHNYGHGGAGVTLSWGCTLEVINLLNEKLGEEILDTERLAHLIKN